jgi:hypothetical protein
MVLPQRLHRTLGRRHLLPQPLDLLLGCSQFSLQAGLVRVPALKQRVPLCNHVPQLNLQALHQGLPELVAQAA